jgi:hypothetical protein
MPSQEFKLDAPYLAAELVQTLLVLIDGRMAPAADLVGVL